jgi:biotin operon repressor
VNVRLTKDQVLLIFDLLRDNIYTNAQIAEMFDVGRTTVTLINQGRIWRHLIPQGWTPAPPIRACGERNGFAKLFEDEVREIFRLAWSGAHSLREIGERFGVSLSQVWLIKRRREWRHLQLDNNEEPTMSEDALKAEIAALKKRQTELEAKLGEDKPPPPQFKPEPHRPIDYTAGATMDRETLRDLAKAIPDALARDLRADLARGNPITQSVAQLTPDRDGGRVQIQRGGGWAEPNPLRQPAGVAICDRIMDMADAQDRRDLERRLARSVNTKE